MSQWKPPGRRRGAGALTPRELEILPLLAAGHTTADIARKLGISPATVKSHLSSLYIKIGAANRIHAARYYLEHHAPADEPETERD